MSCHYLSSAPYIYYRNGYSNRVRSLDRETGQLNRQAANLRPTVGLLLDTHHRTIISQPHQHPLTSINDTGCSPKVHESLLVHKRENTTSTPTKHPTRDTISPQSTDQVRCGCWRNKGWGPASSLQGMDRNRQRGRYLSPIRTPVVPPACPLGEEPDSEMGWPPANGGEGPGVAYPPPLSASCSSAHRTPAASTTHTSILTGQRTAQQAGRQAGVGVRGRD